MLEPVTKARTKLPLEVALLALVVALAPGQSLFGVSSVVLTVRNLTFRTEVSGIAAKQAGQ